MKPSLEQIEAALRASVKETEQLRRQNRDLREASAEPIAIVGMSCRLPGGVESPARLWDLLERGEDGIGAFPADRGWDLERIYDPDPERPATSNTREGGFLAGAGDFDPGFFGVSPREAIGADPQTRLMLEASWEALEDAGVDPTSLRGTPAGVFAGVMYHDYGWGLPPTAEAGRALGTGGSSSIVSGHVAYTLGLVGPALSVDTACSSSLVGIHLACQTLRRGECSLALAGGATVLATPSIFIQFSRQGGVAPDGRCKAFAEAADGAGFSEGVGVLVLERLSDAQANGHRVLATIRGSAVNQDGASNGITAPNGPAQERVIRQALANAGLEPADVDMVEAHGTGTALGDPIEAGALIATYGQERETPIRLGSLKSNIGHAQAAAGVAGVIKAVLAMRAGLMPKTLHVDAPTSHVDWDGGKVELLREPLEWEPNGHPRRAAVSSFGATGTNAHLILEEAPEPPAAGDANEVAPAPLEGPIPLPLSATSEAALQAQAGRLASRLREDEALDPLDLAYSLATTRARFERRGVVLGADRERLLAGLEALERGEVREGVITGEATQEAGAVFLFSGHGSQWPGMAVELLGSSSVFARVMAECEEALAPFIDWSPHDVLRGPDDGWLQQVDVVQPIIFSAMVSLARLWRACGVEPAAVVGHSQGEIAAAEVAGGLSLDDAARLAALRSQMIAGLAGQGGMISIGLPLEQLESELSPWAGKIEVAALNGPTSAVLTGDRESLDALLSRCEEQGVRARNIPGAVAASHSIQMEQLRERLLTELAPLAPRSGEVPFYSTVEGAVVDTAGLDPEYWYRNTRQPVLFEPVVRELLERGHRVLIEVSSHPVLVPAVQETIDLAGSAATALGTLRRDDGGATRFALSLAEAQAHGARLDWRAFFAGRGAKAVPLPTYPFQHKRFWLNGPAGATGLLEAGLTATDHPLLGAAIEDPEGEGLALSGRVSLEAQPWLADHAAFGTVLLPGTAFVEMALRAGAEAGLPVLEELALETPLVIAEDAAALLRVSVAAAGEDGRRELAIYSRLEQAGEGGPWIRHARGLLGAAAGAALEPEAWAQEWPPRGAEAIDVGDVYEQLAKAEIEYGPAFQGLVAAWRRGGELYAELSLPADLAEGARHFGIHPALFDAIGHAGVALSLQDRDALEAGELPMPFAWKGVRLQAAGARTLRVRRSAGATGLTATDENGIPVLSVESVVARPVDRARLRAAVPAARSLYCLEWRPLPSSPQEPSRQAVVEDLRASGAGDPATLSRALAAQVLERMRGHLAQEPEGGRLAILTEGALATSEAEAPDIAAASLSGLVRSAAAEHPGRFCLIDSDGSEASEAALQRALGADPRETEIALREGEPLVPRLVAAKAAQEAPAPELDPERTVLITGATGAIGSLIAAHLVESHGARHLLLVSRSGESAPGALELRARLQEQGAEVSIVACDVADRSQLEGLLAGIPKEHPLGAVIHCAAVIDDGLLDSIDPERLQRVFAPKVDAAWHLHELSAGLGLTHFVCFSSIAGLIGSAAQANYAAANAFCDALAAHRRATGLAGVSMAWGGWEQRSAMTAGLDREQLQSLMRRAGERFGLLALSAEQGLALFDAALAANRALTVPAQLDLALLRSRARSGTLPALLEGIVPARAAGAGGSLARRLGAAPEAEREAIALGAVRGHIAAVLGHDSAAEVDPEKAFKDLGFDSLAAVELRNRLTADSGVSLAPTAVFDYPTPLALAKHLLATSTGAGAGQRVAAARASREEPIAIVGMACRFPGGVESPDQLWQLLARGGDAISPFPADRGWDLERLYDPEPGRPRKSYAKEGGFLYDAADFDPGFFGISPREAIEMDPQQRLMLELSWEGLEEAGIDPRDLRGSPTGVFAGSMYQDYGEVAGMTSSAVSGRISYTLGLEGPALSVDTACSSSLVATHLAAGALRGGECSLALAGGVAVLSTPTVFIEFSRQRGLAPDGRSKAFAEGADGVGVSEGVGVLVLERLADAKANGHSVLATIRGSAVNQDGASNGLSAPNGPSQERVIRQALANAGLGPAEIDMVEAHGTGTPLGDPIEAGALLATYGQEREAPVRIGSLKSNIGHAQAAAGVAGVIKAVLAMREETMPRTLHLDAPSSNVDWTTGKVELLAEPFAWESNGHPRRAAVSSFGATGTNAHMILEEAPEREPAEPSAASPDGPLPFLLSAKEEASLAAQARRLAAHLNERPQLELGDLARSLATTRPAFERRAVVFAAERSQLLEGLAAIAAGKPAGNVSSARARTGKLAFLFSGQGSQRLGMGRGLYESNEACREAFDRVFAELAAHMERPLAEVLWAGEGTAEAALLDRTAFAQPALFAVELATARALESLGLAPDLLAGHSIGGIVAAHLGGVLDLADACTLVAARGRLMDALPQGGAMVAIEAGEEEVAEAIAGTEDALAIAAVNGPRAVVVSGEEEAVEEVAAGFRERDRRTKRLAVSHAFHSPLIEPMLADFGALLAGLELRAPTLPVVSDSSGELLSAEQATDPAYWVAHARQAVRFGAAIETLGALGAGSFVEVGPGSALAALAGESLVEGQGGGAIPTLRQGRAEPDAVLETIGAAHAAGAAVEWEQLFGAPASAPPVALPTYPFRRRRYWLNTALEAGGPGADEHPLLGAAVELAGEGGAVLLSGRVSLSTHPWVADHSLAGLAILPGTALLELALRAAAEVELGLIEELTLGAPLIVPEQGFVQIQVAVAAADEAGRRQITVHSRPERSAGEWVLNASGRLAPDADAPPLPALGNWPPEGAEPLERERLYDLLAERGAELGPAFHGLSAAWRAGDTLLAEAALAEAERAEAERFGLHPALLDSASHAVAGLALEEGGELLLPFAWQGVRLHAAGTSALRMRTVGGEHGRGLVAYDEDGAPVISIEAVTLRAVDEAQLRAAMRPLYSLAWRRVELAADAAPEADIADFRSLGSRSLSEVTDDALRRAQEWLAEESRPSERLTFLTEGAISAAEGEDADPIGAALWGLVRSAQAEHPGRFALLDLDPGAQLASARLDAALAAGVEQPQLALRKGVALVPRLARALGEAETTDEPFDPEATVLITGGTGGLGAAVARHLVAEHYVRHLVLASRAGAEAPGAAELAAALAELGAETVRIESCDVSDRERLRAMLDSIPARHPLGAVLHSAAVLDDGVFESLDRERLARVLAPKAEAAWHLHELTQDLQLSRFVVFSSLAGLLGTPGQANYAAANASLDALAAHRHAAGLPATSIAWGAIDAGGSSLVEDEQVELVVEQVRRRLGIVPMPLARALEMFDAALVSEQPLLAPAEFDTAALRSRAGEGAIPAVLGELVRVPAGRPPEVISIAELLADVPPAEHEAVLLELVRDHAAAVLGHASAEAVEPDRPFQELGFDSLAAVELRNRLGAATGSPLPPTLVFDYPSARKIAAYLLAELAPDADAQDGAGDEIAERELDEAIEQIDGMDVEELIERGLALQGGEE